jgi:hypothetical protein
MRSQVGATEAEAAARTAARTAAAAAVQPVRSRAQLEEVNPDPEPQP